MTIAADRFSLPACAVPAAALAVGMAVAGAAPAQSLPTPAAGAASAARPAAPTPAAPASAPAATSTLERVRVTGARSDTEERRQSTAAKIVVGREEIDRFGDATIGEVLKRLPGITLQGAPGRGGAIRMRGLGSGYTQILLDGQRAPPGFSLDTLTPEQVERIEILRAPTAETGARAIAGTVNIVLREALRRRSNDVRLGLGVENARPQASLSWTRNDTLGEAWTYNVTLSAFRQDRLSESVTTTVDRLVADGSVGLDQRESTVSRNRNTGIHLTSRLQWRGGAGDTLTLSPFVILSSGRSRGDVRLEQLQFAGAAPALYDTAQSSGASDFRLLRLNGNWTRRLGGPGAGGGRLEGNFGIGDMSNPSHSSRNEFDAGGGVRRRLDDRERVHDRAYNANLKYSTLLASDHSLVAGVEGETTRRDESRSTLQNGVPLLPGFGGDIDASSTRLAAYVQDEWTVNPNWAAHAGLRWEGIATRGSTGDGVDRDNRSGVWSPLLHAVWKPAPESRDQVRISLTRSYRAPPLASLVARPVVSTRYPLTVQSQPTSPDRFGNPDLKPELATGLDIALERYLPQGGVLSASVFHRRISNLIRNVVGPETVVYNETPVARFVSRPQNIGGATAQGIELEAKFRASAVLDAAPPVDLRANLAFYRSRVDSVPGPDNRLDQQPYATANLGADYRLRSVPLTLGGNINWTPVYDTRLSATQTVLQGRKFAVDANALWVFDPSLQLRLTASNLTAADYITGNTVDTTTFRETARTTARSYANWQLRLEMKL